MRRDRVRHWAMALPERAARSLIVAGLLGIVGASALAYVTEQSLLSGWAGVQEARYLAVVGVLAALLLAARTAFSVWLAWNRGIGVHLEALREDVWRTRHEVEHRMFERDHREPAALAVVTAPTVAKVDPRNDRWRGDIQQLVDDCVESVTAGSALLPGCRRLAVLAAGDLPSMIMVGWLLGERLPGWRVTSLSDRNRAAGDPFVRFEIPEPEPAPVPKTTPGSGPELTNTQSPAGTSSQPEPDPFTCQILFRNSVNQAQRETLTNLGVLGDDVRVWDERSWDKSGPRLSLPEKPEAYEGLLRDFGKQLRVLDPGSSVSVIFDGPAGLAFALGWTIRQHGHRVRVFFFDRDRNDYLDLGVVPDPMAGPGPAAEATANAGDAGAIAPDSRGRWGRMMGLTVLGWLVALSLTLSAGTVGTFLEWWLAGSGPDDLVRGLGQLAVIIIGSGALGWGGRRWWTSWARPGIVLVPGPTPDHRLGRNKVVVAPRQALETPFAVVRWLRLAIADLQESSISRPLAIDLTDLPDDVVKAIGSFLNRGQRGSDVELRIGEQVYGLPPRSADQGSPAEQREYTVLREGYQQALAFSRTWERPQAPVRTNGAAADNTDLSDPETPGSRDANDL